jgi:crotonobetainyl-CoA:carnitine CoA-transferase CaiB-like acyl-CoA transferase
MSGPLEGIRVVDFTIQAFGPRASEYLAEMGADVIKVESPRGGDPLRGVDVLRGVPTNGFNSYFDQIQRGKKGMTLDLHFESARQAMYKLVEKADIFVTNLRMRGLERLGVDYETVSRLNPRLIYALGTGWGMKGPGRDRGGFEVTGAAGSGVLTNFAEQGTRPPLWPPALGDYIAGTYLAYGIILALYHREKSGKGQLVHTSLLGTFMKVAACCVDASVYANKDMYGMPHGEDGGLYNVYETKDNRFIQIAVMHDDASWAEFCEAVEIEHLKDDPRFGPYEARRENSTALVSILDELFLTRTQSEWMEILDRYNFPWSPVRLYTELPSDPQVIANDYLVAVDYPGVGEAKVVGVNLDLSETPGRVREQAPELSQHTEEILLDMGYTWEEIIAMKEEGAIL